MFCGRTPTSTAPAMAVAASQRSVGGSEDVVLASAADIGAAAASTQETPRLPGR